MTENCSYSLGIVGFSLVTQTQRKPTYISRNRYIRVEKETKVAWEVRKILLIDVNIFLVGNSGCGGSSSCVHPL